jgi:hypothetical protein
MNPSRVVADEARATIRTNANDLPDHTGTRSAPIDDSPAALGRIVSRGKADQYAYRPTTQ